MNRPADCRHEWQMGNIWFGCKPGVHSADMTCTRCGSTKRERVTDELLLRGCEDRIERLRLEIAYRDSPAFGP